VAVANIDLFLPRLDKVKQTAPNKWVALCPAHNDKHPSLGVTLTSDGAILIKCWTGCGAQAIVESVGLSLRDLFPQKAAKEFDLTKPRPKAPRFSKSELFDILLIEAVILAFAYEEQRNGKTISDIDHNRAVVAFNSILRLHSEVYA
jgi:hypothetical protein